MRRPLFISALVAAAFCAPLEAQTIQKITDHKTSFTGPAAMDDAGTTLFFGSTSAQWSTNPEHVLQLFELDTASLLGSAISNFRFGTFLPAQIGSDVPPSVYVSDDGNWLVYISKSDPLGTNADFSPEVFVMSRDGVSVTQLSNDANAAAGSVSRLAFSGDGQRIAFVSNSNLTGANPGLRQQLYTVDRSGLNLLQQTAIVDGTGFLGLGISDDGTRIVFAHDGDLDQTMNDDFTLEVFTLDLDGSVTGPTQLTDDPGDEFESFQTSISGDGTKIVFTSSADLPGASNNKNQDEIYAIDFDGSNLTQLTDTKNNEQGAEGASQAPVITDDGTRIFMHSNHQESNGGNADNNFEIYRIETDGTDWVRQTDSTLNDGSFLPIINADATVIAFNSFEESFDGTARAPLELPEVYFIDDVDADGTAGCDINCNIRQATTGIGGKQFDPIIKLDGSQVFFISTGNLLGQDADQGGELYSVLPDGSGLTQLTLFSSANDSRAPTVPSDASRIAFLSNADPLGLNVDTNLELFIIDADGDASSLDQLTELPDGFNVFGPFFLDDGSRVLFHTAGDAADSANSGGNEEIFAVEPDGTLNTVTQLTEISAGNSQFPRADAAGTLIVFHSTGDFTGGNADASQEIFKMAGAGTNIMQVTDIDGTAERAAQPDITGDGSLIAFASNESFDGTANADENFEIWIYEVATSTLHQVTDTTQGTSFGVRFSRNGDFLFFTTSAGQIVEDDPDEPFHFVRADLRAGLGSITFERVGGFDAGTPFRVLPDQSGEKMAFSGQGSPTYDNPDGLDEVWYIDNTVPLAEIGVSGSAPTAISWTQASGPLRYDVIRGNVSELGFGAGTTDLGTVVCIGEDIKDTSTTPSGSDDAVSPAPGGAFFYLYRGNQGANIGTGSYGQSAAGLERVPAAGDCGP